MVLNILLCRFFQSHLNKAKNKNKSKRSNMPILQLLVAVMSQEHTSNDSCMDSHNINLNKITSNSTNCISFGLARAQTFIVCATSRLCSSGCMLPFLI